MKDQKKNVVKNTSLLQAVSEVGDKKQQEILGNTTRYKSLKNPLNSAAPRLSQAFSEGGRQKKRLASRNGLSRPMEILCPETQESGSEIQFLLMATGMSCWYSGSMDYRYFTSMHLPKLERPHTTSPQMVV